MVSLFGEDNHDRRDFCMGRGGLLADIHSPRIPAGQGDPARMGALIDLLDQVHAAAQINFGHTV